MGNKFTRRRTQIDDRFTRPQGLYQHKDVDHKKLRRLIIDAKLAPCYIGADDAAIDLEECPICFLHYPSLNRSKCCTKGICTECFLQVKAPNSARPTQCPFCKTANYAVEYSGVKTQEEKGVEQAEEQKVIEAKIRIRRQQEIQDEEARLQRRQLDSREVSAVVPAPEGEREPTVPEDRPPEQVSPPERDWDTWTSAHNTAIGYPQSDFFAHHPSRSDAESTWLSGSQRDSGRHDTFTATSARNSSSLNTRRRSPWSNSSYGDIAGQGAGYTPYSRDEDFDLDLEDIMVMEAIWLSIQEQGNHRPVETASEQPFPSPFTEIHDSPLATLEPPDTRGRRGSVTGGFASAIAALAERQMTGSTGNGEQTGQSDTESSANFDGGGGSGTGETVSLEEQIDGITDQAEKSSVEAETTATRLRTSTMIATGSVNNNNDTTTTSNNSNNNNENLTRWIRRGMSVEASSPDALLDQGSEVVETGTSFCSSVPSAPELMLPWEAPEEEDHPNDREGGSGGGGGGGEASIAAPAAAAAIDPAALASTTNVVPESFEEQMMLAMALSLAEAQDLRAKHKTP